MTSGKPTIILTNAAAREKASRWIAVAPHATIITFQKPRRTVPQNARLWALLTEISQQVVWHGQKLSPDAWKCVFTASLHSSRVVPGLDNNFVVIGERTSAMSKSEMSDLQTLIEAFGAQRGVTFHGMDEAPS